MFWRCLYQDQGTSWWHAPHRAYAPQRSKVIWRSTKRSQEHIPYKKPFTKNRNHREKNNTTYWKKRRNPSMSSTTDSRRKKTHSSKRTRTSIFSKSSREIFLSHPPPSYEDDTTSTDRRPQDSPIWTPLRSDSQTHIFKKLELWTRQYRRSKDAHSWVTREMFFRNMDGWMYSRWVKQKYVKYRWCILRERPEINQELISVFLFFS